MSIGRAAQDKRRRFAEQEHMTLYVIDDDKLAIEGDSGNSHVLETVGVKAVDCSCGDRQHRRVRCKHMIAYEEWSIDEVQTSSGITVKL